jgi:hypothetical protein
MFKNNFERVLFFLCFVVAMWLTFHISNALAVTVKLNDGKEINLDGLTDMERSNMIEYIDKLNASQKNNNVMDAVVNSAADPQKLNEWRKVITGTIKDICNDLNVSVNEFVKTPVGLGVAALIFYKVAGKDLITKFIDIVLIIPFWIVSMSIIGLTVRRYLGSKTEYAIIKCKADKINDNELKTKIKDIFKKDEVLKIQLPHRTENYEWSSSDARTGFACIMIILAIVITLISLLIVFLK